MNQMQIVCEAVLNLPAKNGAVAKGAIEARVTTWGAREGADGRKFFYKPEGFMKWADEFSHSGRPLPMFVNHNADAVPVGEWTAFEFDDDGMLASGRLFTNTTAGADLYEVMTESPAMFGGVSVGAYAETCAMVSADGNPTDAEDGYFQITQGGLREVSVVMYPNNPMASVNKLEYFMPDGSVNPRVLERALRDAGLARKDAVAAVSVFKSALAERDVPVQVESAPIVSDSDSEATKEDEILAALAERELIKILNSKLKV
jgi:HK97 family phage prohead protease